jgi:hypothetical protein
MRRSKKTTRRTINICVSEYFLIYSITGIFNFNIEKVEYTVEDNKKLETDNIKSHNARLINYPTR